MESDYIKQLEEQNEQLKERLAVAEKWMLKWEEGPKNVFKFGMYGHAIAYVSIDALKQTWKASVTFDNVVASSKKLKFKNEKEAMEWCEALIIGTKHEELY